MARRSFRYGVARPEARIALLSILSYLPISPKYDLPARLFRRTTCASLAPPIISLLNGILLSRSINNSIVRYGK